MTTLSLDAGAAWAGPDAVAELADLRAEMEGAYTLTSRQADLLTGVVNALRGAPPEDTLWSHHDAAELAKKAVLRITELEALLQMMHKTNHVLAGRAVPVAERANFSVACACGHAPEEHGHDPKYPGSTACTVAGCDCIAYERGE